MTRRRWLVRSAGLVAALMVASVSGCHGGSRQSPAPSPSPSRSAESAKVDIVQAFLGRDRFVGRLYEPDRLPHKRLPGVLIIGGSEGGLASSDLASALASEGYPSLAVAYFRYPYLPRQLSNIQMEYFVRAAHWLRGQPGVPSRVIIIGISRGSEAAEQLAYLDAGHVRAVIAAVPSNVRLCGLPHCVHAAWTWHGRALPFTKQFDEAHPTDNPRAVIPLYRARAAVLLICAGADQVWTSCAYSRAIQQQLRQRRYAWPHSLLTYPRADHYVGGLVPGVSLDQLTTDADQDEKAREDLWPRLLAFLHANASLPTPP